MKVNFDLECVDRLEDRIKFIVMAKRCVRDVERRLPEKTRKRKKPLTITVGEVLRLNMIYERAPVGKEDEGLRGVYNYDFNWLGIHESFVNNHRWDCVKWLLYHELYHVVQNSYTELYGVGDMEAQAEYFAHIKCRCSRPDLQSI